MENLIFEILKMAGFIVVLFLCCLWLVKDKRSFYKFRDWGLIPLTALAGFVIYCIGYWEAGTKESLITLVVRSFLSTFHMFFLLLFQFLLRYLNVHGDRFFSVNGYHKFLLI